VKKIIAMLLAGLLLASLSACGKDIGIIGGADGPTAIIVAGGDSQSGQSQPARVEHEYTNNNDEHCTHYMTVKAYDENDALLWEYVTPDSLIGQCEDLEYLGMENGLVYINENGIYDSQTMGDDMSRVYGRLRALNAADGTVAWDNADYSGSGSSCVFDDTGCIYVTGYFGPDCMKIDSEGRTVWSVPCVDEDLYWAYGISLENDVLTVSYEMNENYEADTARISVDGEILG